MTEFADCKVANMSLADRGREGIATAERSHQQHRRRPDRAVQTGSLPLPAA
jgi:hypothetical protein